MTTDKTRYHEAGHGFGAVKFGIDLDDRGIEINSDQDACTYIGFPKANSLADEQYCIRRAAVKLAGPAAQLRFEGRSFTQQELESDHRTIVDLREAERILQQYWSRRGERNDREFERQLADAATIAHNAVQSHWDEVEEVARTSIETGRVSAAILRGIVEPATSLAAYFGRSTEPE